MHLNQKNVVLTGGSMGIGLSLAQKLLAEGANVLVCARSKTALEKAKLENPGLETVQCDVTVKSEVEHLLAESKRRLGGVDILINNAAIFRLFGIQGDYPIENQLQEIDINFGGTVQVTNIFLPALLESKEPMIVNLTSGLGYIPVSAAPIYSATKAAINSWTWSLRHQLKDTPINVVLLSPPVVDTRMNQNNPTSEGMKKISPEEFAEITIRGFKRNKKEILAKPINSLKYISRIVPNLAFKMLNKHKPI